MPTGDMYTSGVSKHFLSYRGEKTGGKRGFNIVEKTLDLVAEGKKQTYMC